MEGGERGIKTPGREVFRDKHICARGIVWMWELTTRGNAGSRHDQPGRDAQDRARAGILVLHDQVVEISPLKTRSAHKGILFLFFSMDDAVSFCLSYRCGRMLYVISLLEQEESAPAVKAAE